MSGLLTARKEVDLARRIELADLRGNRERRWSSRISRPSSSPSRRTTAKPGPFPLPWYLIQAGARSGLRPRAEKFSTNYRKGSFKSRRTARNVVDPPGHRQGALRQSRPPPGIPVPCRREACNKIRPCPAQSRQRSSAASPTHRGRTPTSLIDPR